MLRDDDIKLMNYIELDVTKLILVLSQTKALESVNIVYCLTSG